MTTTVKPLTGPQTNALRALAAAEHPQSPRAVARALWPLSIGWERRTHMYGGRQGAVGGTMPMKAATLLWRLEARGCASYGSDYLWTITPRGRRVLDGTDQPLPVKETT